jgi:hypothetical protein
VATHGNRFGAHGKEGVDGSSPSEGLQNPRSRGLFVQSDLLFGVRAVGMEPFMELSRLREARFVVSEDNLAVAGNGVTSSRPPLREGGGRGIRQPRTSPTLPQRRMGRVAGSDGPLAQRLAPTTRRAAALERPKSSA